MAQAIDTGVSVRAIVPSDADNYRSILLRTSPQDRFCRFFHAVGHFDDEAVARYVESNTEAIGLIAEQRGRPLGVAHAFFIDKESAEIAMLVANDAQHGGVGRLLFDRLMAALQQRRCVTVIAYALLQNNAFIHLARSVGMRPRSCDGGVVTWTLSHADLRSIDGAPAARRDAEASQAWLQQALQAVSSLVISSLLMRSLVEIALLSVVLDSRTYARRFMALTTGTGPAFALTAIQILKITLGH
jgi:GNAT superfamily N-acetyltransferase